MEDMQAFGYQLMLNVKDEENEAKEKEEDEEEMLIAPNSPDMHEPTAGQESAASFLEMAFRSIENRTNGPTMNGNDAGDHGQSGCSDAEILALRAKLRIMQEEMEQVSSDYYKKDNGNAKLNAQMKEMEKERVRLQKTTSVQQTQIEKHRALVEESVQKCATLQQQVLALNKEIQNLKRFQKEAAAIHSSKEVHLNRAVEEMEKVKTQLNKIQQMNKQMLGEEHRSKEDLLAENKVLKKQKEELILNFRKQHKLTDIHKRQKMYFESDSLLSFTKEEFIKALDWGNTQV
ncbi:testis-expressed protein 9-like [Nelusetta ayraudi]|uniref:testis-expressed protein 9-like n=1 Tax=Nelusetta ayraudi TaxID=303726 RepID=UPI003F71C4C9